MTKNLTDIWTELTEKGEYTPTWKAGEELESLTECLNICKALAELTKVVSCCGVKIEYYWRESQEFGIYHTYDFGKYKSSEEPGFAKSSHYIIRLHKNSVSKLTKKDRKKLGW